MARLSHLILVTVLAAMFTIIPTRPVDAEGGCDPADAGTIDQCVALAAQARVSVFSTGPSVAVSNVAPSVVTSEQQRFIEINTTTLPAITAPTLLSAYCDAVAAHSPVCFLPQVEHSVMLKAERQEDGDEDQVTETCPIP